jgi:hypothetical protein
MMESSIKFGPKEQTREQRQRLCDQAAAINAAQDRQLEPFAEDLCQRYIAGEMSMDQVIEQVNDYHNRKYGILASEPLAQPVKLAKTVVATSGQQ